ncbi:MAG TPA: sulfurtransferase-like selenium metabolism protein YedF [Desulfobulbus sp.]|nr:sulfurtransferase-like selenium metabolism protein YedF [Desulfobulbus sp.]
MTTSRLDCRGLACPEPVIRTKDSLEQGVTELEVIVDNEASMKNVTRFVRSRGCAVEVATLADGCYSLRISGSGAPAAEGFDAAEYSCELPAGSGLVYVISSDSMGRGSDELGWALLQTYVQTIREVDPLPEKILLYNGGVKLVTGESGALEALQELQRRGVEILACGTCLDFFGLRSAIKVGEISNMYDIMRSMASASRIVSPF